MKATELRINNYASQGGEIILGIVGNTLHKFEMREISLQPIPLTEELTIK